MSTDDAKESQNPASRPENPVPAGFSVRPATVEDAAGIARVHVDSWRETYQGIVPDDYLRTLSYNKREEGWSKMLAGEPAPWRCYVAVDAEGTVCGFVNIGRAREADFTCGEFSYSGEIYAIYLMKQCQGQGLGRALFTAACHGLKSQGMQGMYLWVLRDNPTRAFYRHMGGNDFAEKTLEIGGRALAEIAMGWENI